MAEYHYNPDDVNVLVVGPGIVVDVYGYSPGAFITASRTVQRFVPLVGVDGEVGRRRMRSRMGQLSVTLEEGSESNALLQALHTLDDITQSGICVVYVRDRNTLAEVVLATHAWIVGPPAYSKEERSGSIQWVFDVGRYEILRTGLRQV